MKTEFKESFLRDLRNIKEKELLTRLEELINLVETAENLTQISNLKKLKGKKRSRYYRSKIGDYRVGFIVDEDVIVFVRFLHRREIYRYFP